MRSTRAEEFHLRQRRATFHSTNRLDQFDFDRLKLNRARARSGNRSISQRTRSDPSRRPGRCRQESACLSARSLSHSPRHRCAVQPVRATHRHPQCCTCRRRCLRAQVRLLARVPLLIIDDSGLKPLRPPADEDLHDLIAERCRHHRYQQSGLSRMGSGVPQQPAARLRDRGSGAPQRLLPDAHIARYIARPV
jgi:hypothetical protein